MDLVPGEVTEEEHQEPGALQQAATGKRFGPWWTVLSFGIALAILVFGVSKAGITWSTTARTLAHTSLPLFALAFAVYYLAFPIRAYRWRQLMHNAHHGSLQQQTIERCPLWELTQILYLSWFVNVVIPAKLGDVYRAYLARRRLGVTLSRTVGTILAERILDLVVQFSLLLITALLTFQAPLLSAHGSSIRLVLLIGLALVVGACGVLVVVWRTAEGVLSVLPRPLHGMYRHFRQGAVSSLGRHLPALVSQTVVIWLLEGAHLACILWAVGLATVGFPPALFIVLGAAVLNTLPLTPGGLGVVETFIVAILVVLAVPGGPSTGAAVVVLDRLITYLSIVVIGFGLHVFTATHAVAMPQDMP